MMKYVLKLLKTTKVMLMLAYPMLTQNGLVPHQYFGNNIRHGPKSNNVPHGE